MTLDMVVLVMGGGRILVVISHLVPGVKVIIEAILEGGMSEVKQLREDMVIGLVVLPIKIMRIGSRRCWELVLGKWVGTLESNNFEQVSFSCRQDGKLG